MKKLLLAMLVVSPLMAQAWETRCGWLHNPTPANWWLSDKDGTWMIGVQGGYQARGMDSIEIRNDNEWVITNAGSYGYGCACAQVRVDRTGERVLEIRNVNQKLLKTCLQDVSLPNPGVCP